MGDEVSSIFGPVPWPWPQESGSSELLAAAEALAHALPPIHLFNDSQLLIDGWEAGVVGACVGTDHTERYGQFFGAGLMMLVASTSE